ncbi:MAG: SsrA-binding protein SmpB [Planctomycetota bacterium]
MARGSKNKGKPKDLSPRIVNRRARHDYAISDTYECGVALLGTEVKSVRHGRVSLQEGWAEIHGKTGQLLLRGVEISPYLYAGPAHQHTPKRDRVLLAHKREIRKLLSETSASGVTLVPIAMYFVNGRVKVEIGVGTGKKAHDKRNDIKKRDAERDMRRAMTRKVLR